MRHPARPYPFHQAAESDSSLTGGIAIIVMSLAAILYIVSSFVDLGPKLATPGDFGVASINEMSR